MAGNSSFLGSQVKISTRTVTDAPTAKVIDDVVSAVNTALDSKTSSDVPFAPLLTSPSGSIFMITVGDDGTLATKLVRTP